MDAARVGLPYLFTPIPPAGLPCRERSVGAMMCIPWKSLTIQAAWYTAVRLFHRYLQLISPSRFLRACIMQDFLQAIILPGPASWSAADGSHAKSGSPHQTRSATIFSKTDLYRQGRNISKTHHGTLQTRKFIPLQRQ